MLSLSALILHKAGMEGVQRRERQERMRQKRRKRRTKGRDRDR